MSDENLDQLGRSPAYWQGMEEGKKHSTPSPETRAMIKEIKDDIRETKDDIKEFSHILNDLAIKVAEWGALQNTQNGNVARMQGKITTLENWKEQHNSKLLNSFVFVSIALFTAVISLVSYIFFNAPVKVTEAQLIEALENVELYEVKQ